jgi:hypothetical protein
MTGEEMADALAQFIQDLEGTDRRLHVAVILGDGRVVGGPATFAEFSGGQVMIVARDVLSD